MTACLRGPPAHRWNRFEEQAEKTVDSTDENNYRCHIMVEPASKRNVLPFRTPPKRVSSAALFRGRREIVIVHGGREYCLRLTHDGKLILTA